MIRFIIFIFLLIQFIYSQDKGLSSFEKENYKESFEYYLKVLESRENDISAKFGAGISAFKNQDIETGMKYLQEVSNSEDEIINSIEKIIINKDLGQLLLGYIVTLSIPIASYIDIELFINISLFLIILYFVRIN